MDRAEFIRRSEQICSSISFGVELEFCGITRRSAALLIESELQRLFPDCVCSVSKYYHSRRDIYDVKVDDEVWFTLKYDGSISSYHFNANCDCVEGRTVFRSELVTKPMYLRELWVLKPILKALIRGDSETYQCMLIDKNCGCHIHVSAETLDICGLKALCNNVYSKQSLLTHSVGESKKSVRYQYMQWYPEKLVESLKTVTSMIEFRNVYFAALTTERYNIETEVNRPYKTTRYYLLNLCPLWDNRGFNTVEFRLFGSTDDFEVLSAYIMFCLKFVAYCSLVSKSSYRDESTLSSKSQRYRMHCFLNKIGCDSKSYKNVRRVFLENLEGKSAHSK